VAEAATGTFSETALLATALAHALSVYEVSTSVPTGLVASCVSVALAHFVLGKYVETPSLSVNGLDPNLMIAQGKRENHREKLCPRSNASLERHLRLRETFVEHLWGMIQERGQIGPRWRLDSILRLGVTMNVTPIAF
jgi:hypothetical protein